MISSAPWAARYQFLEELWSGQPRILLDPELEHAIATAAPGFAHNGPPALTHLADELVPRTSGGAATWCAVTHVQPEHLQRDRPGTRFVTVHALPELLHRQRFEVALLDLRALLDEETTDTGIGRTSRRVEDRFGPVGREIVDALVQAAAALRTLVLMAPLAEFPSTGGGFTYEELAGLVARLGGGRIFAVYDAPMLAVAEYGEAITGDEDFEDGDYDDEDEESYADADQEEEEEAPLTFDNTLAATEPPVASLMAIVGAPEFLAQGLTLVELPAAAPGREHAGDPAGLSAQVQQARRQADLAEIARHQLFETVSALREQNARLAGQLDALAAERLDDADPVAALTGGRMPQVDALQTPHARVDEEAAIVLELRLRMQQLEEEVEVLRKREVSELEAEVAGLRARVAAGDPNAAVLQPVAAEVLPTPQVVRPSFDPDVLSVLDRLLARLERDEQLQAQEVRTALLQIRDRLRGA